MEAGSQGLGACTHRGVTENTEKARRKVLEENSLTGKMIGAAIEVHRHIGPGLLESADEECLCSELSRASGKPIGLLIHCNIVMRKDGIQRVLNGYPVPPCDLRVLRDSVVKSASSKWETL